MRTVSKAPTQASDKVFTITYSSYRIGAINLCPPESDDAIQINIDLIGVCLITLTQPVRHSQPSVPRKCYSSQPTGCTVAAFWKAL